MEYEEFAKLLRGLSDAIVFSSIGQDRALKENMKQFFERIYKESLDYERDKKNISNFIDSIEHRIENISGMLLNIDTEKANLITELINKNSKNVEERYQLWKKDMSKDISISRQLILKSCEYYQNYIDILINEMRKVNKQNRDIEIPNRVIL